nr:FAD-dependent monooxygenase [Neorhizobium lilium]
MSIPCVDVAIIGGGPGGLALAQGLKKNGIDTAVFERDAIRADYVQGFRMRIRQRGIDALQADMPPHLFQIFIDTLGRAPTESLEALCRALRVTAVTRSTDLAPQERLITLKADIADEDDVAKIVAGHDAVIGAHSPGVRRIIMVGGAGSLKASPGVDVVIGDFYPAEHKDYQ